MITTPPLLAPAVSVVMPMYNAEKYIGACLESILNQTLQDFEVVVVDNGSTDNSAAVLESYVPRFGGRLKTSRIEKNSGGPSPAYNKAEALSRGKYVFVMDSDDLLMNNALETFYNAAEKFGADVVYTDRGFRFNMVEDKPFPAQEELQISGWQGQGPFVEKPTLDPENLAERINLFCSSRIGWTPWEKLVRRDLLIENDITFPLIKSSGDIVWTIEILCHSKKFLRIPQPLYVYRSNPASITRKKRTPQEEIKFWMEINLGGLQFMDDWLSRQKFFQENPQYKLNLLEFFNGIHCNNITQALQNLPLYEAYEILKSTFAEKFGGQADLIAYLCTSSNLSRLRLLMASQRIAELENQLKQIQGS